MKTLKQQLLDVFNEKYEDTTHVDAPDLFSYDTLYKAVSKWLEQKPSDYTVTYVPNSKGVRPSPTHYLNKEKLLEELKGE